MRVYDALLVRNYNNNNNAYIMKVALFFPEGIKAMRDFSNSGVRKCVRELTGET